MSSNFFCASSIVIFGGTGDLATRKLIPALARLNSASLLPKNFHLFPTGRSRLSKEQFIEKFINSQQKIMAEDSNFTAGFANLKDRIHYIQVEPGSSKATEDFSAKLRQLEPAEAPARLFYLAVPPSSIDAFARLVKHLSDQTTNEQCQKRILVEKPFGENLESSVLLNKSLTQAFDEDQILRIDHYLGKEAVQNIMVMRFANTFFEPVWNNHYIDNVQITFSEAIGIDKRADYFDKTGILKDVVQNHLLQVLCMVAMEPPLSHTPEDIRLEKSKILKAIRKLRPEEVATETIRARYKAGNKMKGYLEEPGVDQSSLTETYAACRLFIDNWRWGTVPFYLRAGKRLDKNMTEICVSFKKLPHNIFANSTLSIAPNRLYIRIQPDEGIKLLLNSKPPGMSMQVTDVGMRFSYAEEFGDYRPDAYERLLLDALKSDNSLFISNAEIEESWKFIDPIIQGWNKYNQPLYEYEAGSAGPDQACELLRQHQHEWCQL